MFEDEPTTEADLAVARVLAARPGPDATAALAGIDPKQLTAAGRLDAMAAWQAQVAWAEGQTAGLLAAHVTAAERSPITEQCPDARHSGYVVSSTLHEVGLVLHLSPVAVGIRCQVASDLADRLPATFDALQGGRISWQHAKAVSDQLVSVTDRDAETETDALIAENLPDVVTAVDTLAAQAGPGLTPARLRDRLRRLVDRLDPDAAAERIRRAHAERRAERYDSRDGGQCLALSGDPRDVNAMWQALTHLAGPREADDPRTLANRRFDAALAVMLTAAGYHTTTTEAGHDAGTAGGPVPRLDPAVQVQLVVDLATLAGLADHPAELPGYGPIPAHIAREWLRDATSWRRLVTDPVTGHLLDYGPTVRYATTKLKDYLKARDRVCTFPGCRQPTTRCDTDHQPPWRADGTGGHTSARDLAMLCEQHHQWKTHRLWQLTRGPDGASIWTSRTGRTYRSDRPPTLDSGDPPDPRDAADPADPPEPEPDSPDEDPPPF